MSERTATGGRSDCRICGGWGCEACKGGPGEQGFTLDEKQLMSAQDDNRRLRALVLDVEIRSRAGVSCPWCGGPKGQHAENCKAFSGPGAVR